jgi:D-aspartate ligase
MARETVPDKGALLLGGAHDSLEIARSLGRRGIPVYLVTRDNPLAAMSRYVTRRFRWPAPDRADDVGYLLELAGEFGLAGWVLFAAGDAEVRFVAQNHAALGAVFALTTPEWDVVRWAYDKRLMNTRAAELGIAQPRCYYPRSRDDLAGIGLRYPVILKPTVDEGRPAFVDAKARRADNRDELAARYDAARQIVGADTLMIQELIAGDGTAQFSYAAVCDRGTPVGSLVARRRRQYPIDFGFTSTCVETISLPSIEQAACRFLGSLQYSGLAEIEFKYDARDRLYKILDVNPRAWTWISLGAAAGIDFAAMQWELALGRKPAPVSARPGMAWRYLSRDLVAAVQEMFAGALSPTDYLRSLRPSAASAVFSRDDPWPAVLDLPLAVARTARRRFERSNRDAAAARLTQAKRLP